MTFLKPTLFLLLLSASVYAQKLPIKQQNSVLAPANIKIDGKLTEWDEKFQAYNDVSRIYYTISNDERNIYLTARMDGERANMKALYGGITFTIRQVGQNNKSKDVKNVAVTYPVIISKGGSLSGRKNDMGEIISGSPVGYKGLIADKANADEINAFIAKTNKQMETYFKEIQVLGVKEIKETLIPTYNTDDIKAIVLFSNKMEYTYELAVPLKLIEANLGKIEKLNYNIKLNAKPIITAKGVPGPPMFMGNDPEMNYVSNATDFSGDYTLAK